MYIINIKFRKKLKSGNTNVMFFNHEVQQLCAL